jgi:hypothetical protein
LIAAAKRNNGCSRLSNSRNGIAPAGGTVCAAFLHFIESPVFHPFVAISGDFTPTLFALSSVLSMPSDFFRYD